MVSHKMLVTQKHGPEVRIFKFFMINELLSIYSIYQDPFESFRKQRAGAFYTRMRDKADEKKKDKKDKRDKDRDEGSEYTGEADY